MNDFYRSVYAVVARIPPGRVATYGQIAALSGRPGAARQVGYALAAAPRSLGLPWQRVINARGEISRRADPDDEAYQRMLLSAEGVAFDANGRVSLQLYLWDQAVGAANLKIPPLPVDTEH